jgi:hypothetical protein
MANQNEAPSEVAVIREFAAVINDRFNNVDDLMSSVDYRSDEYQAERRLISEMNGRAIKWGIGSTFLTFAALRGAPYFIRRFRSSSNFQQISPLSTSMLPPTSSRPKPLRTLFSIGFDGLLSAMVGFNVTLFLTDMKKVQEGFAAVPLVEGRSVVSDALCLDFIKTYHMTQAKGFDWSKSNYQHSQISYIFNFVLNCKKRQAYEEQLRREQGLDQTQSVCIPSPGVPQDQPYSDNNLRKSEYSEWDKDSFSDDVEDRARLVNNMVGYEAEEVSNDVMNGEGSQKWNSFDDFEDSGSSSTEKNPKRKGRW